MQTEFQPLKLPSSESVGQIQHFKEISSGAGSTIWKVNQEGQFMGATNFNDAPWRVTYEGVQRLGADGQIVLDGPNGTITVGSTTVIDETGLNSTQNFQSDSRFGLGPYSTTSTSYVDLSGASLDPFTLDRSARVLVFVSFQGTMGTPQDFIEDGDVGFVQVTDEIGPRAGCVFSGSAATEIDWDSGTGLIDSTTYRLLEITYSDFSVLTMSAGTHTLKAQMKVNSGSSCEIDSLNFGYLVLGL